MPATAEETRGETPYPAVSGELTVEVEDDWVASANDTAAELNDLYTTIELGGTVAFTPRLSLNGTFVFEPVKDAVDDRYFEDHGAYVEEVFLQYNWDVASVLAGKFNPGFGTAWELTPGLYGTDFAEDYELTEMLGGGVRVPFTLGGADHVAGANLFFADTTFLSRSAFTDRGRLRESDGGAANTEAPQSFSLTLDGTVPETAFAYHVGARFLHRGEGDPADEKGVVAGLSRAWSLGDDQAVEALAEMAYLVDQGGQRANAFYSTVGAAYSIGPWSAAASYSLRDTDHGGTTDHLAQLDLGYTFDLGERGELGVEAGYRYGREGGETSHTLGTLLVYAVAF